MVSARVREFRECSKIHSLLEDIETRGQLGSHRAGSWGAVVMGRCPKPSLSGGTLNTKYIPEPLATHTGQQTSSDLTPIPDTKLTQQT